MQFPLSVIILLGSTVTSDVVTTGAMLIRGLLRIVHLTINTMGKGGNSPFLKIKEILNVKYVFAKKSLTDNRLWSL